MKDQEVYTNLNKDALSDEVYSLIPDLTGNDTIKRQKAREKLESLLPGEAAQTNELIKSKNDQLRWEVAKALQKKPGKMTIPVILKLLSDEESNIRWIAAEGLIRAGRMSLIPVLKEITGKRNVVYGKAAHHVLKGILSLQEKEDNRELMEALRKTTIDVTASVRAKELLDNLQREILSDSKNK